MDWLTQRVGVTAAQQIERRRTQCQGLVARLEALSPQATLERGYAIVTDRGSGKVIYRTQQVGPGQALTVRVSDGQFDVAAQ